MRLGISNYDMIESCVLTFLARSWATGQIEYRLWLIGEDYSWAIENHQNAMPINKKTHLAQLCAGLSEEMQGKKLICPYHCFGLNLSPYSRFIQRWNGKSPISNEEPDQIPCPTILHDLFEYILSQITFEAIMNTEMNNLWPEEPQAMGNHAFRCCSRTNTVKVTDKYNVGHKWWNVGVLYLNPRRLKGILDKQRSEW